MVWRRKSVVRKLAENFCSENKKTYEAGALCAWRRKSVVRHSLRTAVPKTKNARRCRGFKCLAREIGGATFAENGCSENKKRPPMLGLSVFGAGNQWCDVR